MKQNRMTQKINWIIPGTIGLLLLAIGAALWAYKLMDSAQRYRSPIARTPPAPGQSLGNPLTHQMVIILIDALRYDTSTNSTVMPFLNSLRSQGASAIMHSQPPSFSAPGWATILTGSWPTINDAQLFNPPDATSARTFTQDDIFAAAQHAGLKTAVSGYAWFEGMLANSGVDASFYTIGEDNAADVDVVNAAMPWLKNDYQLILIHLDQVDYAGHHQGGPMNPNWDAAATRADALLRNIVVSMDLSVDTVMVISDHGQINRGGHGGADPVTLVEPFVIAGKSVVPGVYGNINMVDIAPTMAVLLGTNIPASSQGHVLANMLSIPPAENVAVQNALIMQQSQLFIVYSKAIGSTTSVGPGEIVTATQAALNQGIQARQSSERIWRNVLAAFLAILPGYVLFIRKEKRVLWMLAGAILYFALFNLRYAIIDGRTYSLASVDGATWLITYGASTAAVSAIIGWLVPMIGLHAFSTGIGKAITTTLGYIWFTIYLLALPILLSFAINGILINWTLPEWYTLFICLLCLIQSMTVTIFGLLMTGIMAGLGKLIPQKV
jgi:hypothetical protein